MNVATIEHGPSASFPAPARSLGVDEGFPRRVVRVSLVLTALGVVFACRAGAWRVAIGFGAGGVLSAVAFVVLAWTVGALVGRSSLPGWRKAALVALALIKIPILLAALAWALYGLEAQPAALVAGLAMTQVVMVLKVVGILCVSHQGREAESQKDLA